MNLQIDFVLPHWLYWAVLAGLPLIVMLLVDRSFRRGGEVSGGDTAETPVATSEQAYAAPGNVVTRGIDRISGFAGRYVAYWSLIAPFVFTYEVVLRYAFNSPTNWAHEGMYLMFGMQYLIMGAYAMLSESHVRVDIFYAPLSPRRKALADILTSVFFFIFAGVLLVTGWIFAATPGA